ncbi:hypothetical protein EMIHUDRAFT_220162 [Emiliania huxleyi CCMP1516]|uniref:Uncharacterized protein n=2 Tax=Emiliania huxleyi TaxID=2903 RepID=A0A0D3I347_EMIH1|nr:hypothetical protein EMIHUDRAFT_220162 [Emiliania huxleyi CCMP1516]EOD05682.1 hypothetical protein EMIHUDRAFT_220162 [Emiliania huxleyi CCMP1516]|eukprot:XP_005758111.1 hypothetical protein EMIHUDRAFT_220162 [Emiliania huxleyi CCMP1516]
MHKRKSRGTLLASAGLAGEPARSPPGGSAAPAAPASAASPAKRPRPLPMLAEPTARGVPLAGGGGGRMAKNFINDGRPSVYLSGKKKSGPGSAASAGHSVASLGQALLDREAQEEAAKEAAAQAAHDEAAKEEAPPSAPAPVQSGVGERERRQRKAPSRWAADPLSVLNLGGRLSELEQARANV